MKLPTRRASALNFVATRSCKAAAGCRGCRGVGKVCFDCLFCAFAGAAVNEDFCMLSRWTKLFRIRMHKFGNLLPCGSLVLMKRDDGSDSTLLRSRATSSRAADAFTTPRCIVTSSDNLVFLNTVEGMCAFFVFVFFLPAHNHMPLYLAQRKAQVSRSYERHQASRATFRPNTSSL